MVEVAGNLKIVRDRIIAASTRRSSEYQYFEPRLVAVSKIKPAELVISAYEAGQRYFGENYVNELVDKANHPAVLEKCKDIRWHFIGHLQKNKINKLLGTPNLYMIETVDNEKLATAIHGAWPKFRAQDSARLKVMVQVNTSKEEDKNGCDVKDAPSLVKHVLENCTNLEFVGLMTIGMFGYDHSKDPNPDFVALKQCKADVCKELNLDPKSVELSMGMSNDYEHAVELGSSSVRVGTAIFGERPKKESQAQQT
ncbi:pyridoxal phosphate homeostasis protein [Orussus abietinus]|uniref:pyridoxal phosphate homeostasis protein n=1 Tax=Orussus abietinus TaxID=222816 RepID=UPI00062649A2|nr:pyridoxal phosphate homeostasis protein [Orussus abietinus]